MGWGEWKNQPRLLYLLRGTSLFSERHFLVCNRNVKVEGCSVCVVMVWSEMMWYVPLLDLWNMSLHTNVDFFTASQNYMCVSLLVSCFPASGSCFQSSIVSCKNLILKLTGGLTKAQLLKTASACLRFSTPKINISVNPSTNIQELSTLVALMHLKIRHQGRHPNPDVAYQHVWGFPWDSIPVLPREFLNSAGAHSNDGGKALGWFGGQNRLHTKGATLEMAADVWFLDILCYFVGVDGFGRFEKTFGDIIGSSEGFWVVFGMLEGCLQIIEALWDDFGVALLCVHPTMQITLESRLYYWLLFWQKKSNVWYDARYYLLYSHRVLIICGALNFKQI